MPRTDRLGWIYPTEDQPNWWEIFAALINQQDADVWASLENGGLVLAGGGEIALDTSTNTLSWTEDLYVLSTLTGGRVTIAAGSVTLNDGNVAYVSVTRPLSSSYTATLSVTSSPLDPTIMGNAVFVALRYDGQLVMRPFQGRRPLIDKTSVKGTEITTGSAAASGGTVSGSIDVGTNDGNIDKLRVTAIGNTVLSTIEFFTDAGLSDLLYRATNKDCYTTPHDDRIAWPLSSWTATLTNDLLYYKITNNGANPSTYTIEMTGEGRL